MLHGGRLRFASHGRLDDDMAGRSGGFAPATKSAERAYHLIDRVRVAIPATLVGGTLGGNEISRRPLTSKGDDESRPDRPSIQERGNP